jgi:Tfp pilus assembly protein PilF
LANLHLVNEEYAQADALIQQASALAADPSDPVQARLLWHSAQNQWDRCIALAVAHQENYPDDTATGTFAAHLLMGSKDARHHQAAKQLLEHVAERRPDDPQSHAELGSVCYLLDQIAEARSAFERGLSVDPDNIRLLNDLAWLLCEDQGDPEAAAKWAGKAIKSGSDNPILLDTWGVVQYRLGNLHESREVLEKCLTHPRVRLTTKVAVQFHLARTLAKLDQRTDAHILLKEVLKNPLTEKVLRAAEREEARRLLEGMDPAKPPGPKSDG